MIKIMVFEQNGKKSFTTFLLQFVKKEFLTDSIYFN